MSLTFEKVRAGNYVLVEDDSISTTSFFQENWVAYVMNVIPGARDPYSNSLFQVMNVDTYVISIINADTVTRIL